MGSSCLELSLEHIFCVAPENHVHFKFFFFHWLQSLFTSQVLVLPLSSPPSHQRSPCVQVPHLCFGCCADGSLLVLHNGSKVTVAHAINTHSKFSSPAVSFASFCSFYQMMFFVALGGSHVHAVSCCGLELTGSYSTTNTLWHQPRLLCL